MKLTFFLGAAIFVANVAIADPLPGCNKPFPLCEPIGKQAAAGKEVNQSPVTSPTPSAPHSTELLVSNIPGARNFDAKRQYLWLEVEYPTLDKNIVLTEQGGMERLWDAIGRKFFSQTESVVVYAQPTIEGKRLPKVVVLGVIREANSPPVYTRFTQSLSPRFVALEDIKVEYDIRRTVTVKSGIGSFLARLVDAVLPILKPTQAALKILTRDQLDSWGDDFDKFINEVFGQKQGDAKSADIKTVSGGGLAFKLTNGDLTEPAFNIVVKSRQSIISVAEDLKHFPDSPIYLQTALRFVDEKGEAIDSSRKIVKEDLIRKSPYDYPEFCRVNMRVLSAIDVMPVDSAAVLAGYLYNTQWNQSSDARANPAPDDCELSMEELKATNLAEKKYIKQRKDILPGVPVAPALSQIGDDLFKAFQSRDSKQILPWLSTQALILFKTNTFSIEFDNGFAVALNQDNGEITFDAQGSADILTTWSLALVPNLVPCLSGVPAQSGVGSEPKKVAVKSCMKTMTKDGKIISVPTVFVFENALYDEKLPRKITQILLSPNSPVSETTYPQAELNQAIDRLVKAGKIKPK